MQLDTHIISKQVCEEVWYSHQTHIIIVYNITVVTLWNYRNEMFTLKKTGPIKSKAGYKCPVIFYFCFWENQYTRWAIRFRTIRLVCIGNMRNNWEHYSVSGCGTDNVLYDDKSSRRYKTTVIIQGVPKRNLYTTFNWHKYLIIKVTK